MSEKVKELLKKVSSDEALKAKLKNCKSEDDVLDFAKELGFDITKDDLKIDKEKLSEKELEMISGGARIAVDLAACECELLILLKDGATGLSVN